VASAKNIDAEVGAVVVGGPARAFAAAAPQRINGTTSNVSFGIQDCLTQNMTTNTVTTPSGSTIYTVDGSYTETFTDSSGAVISTASGTIHIHELTVDAMLKAMSDQTFSTFTAGGLTCTNTQQFSYSNGTFHFDNTTSSCT
jgi:hypothetical protein